jgi:hypothetical protein
LQASILQHFLYFDDSRGIDALVDFLSGMFFEEAQKMEFAVSRDPRKLVNSQAPAGSFGDVLADHLYDFHLMSCTVIVGFLPNQILFYQLKKK